MPRTRLHSSGPSTFPCSAPRFVGIGALHSIFPKPFGSSTLILASSPLNESVIFLKELTEDGQGLSAAWVPTPIVGVNIRLITRDAVETSCASGEGNGGNQVFLQCTSGTRNTHWLQFQVGSIPVFLRPCRTAHEFLHGFSDGPRGLSRLELVSRAVRLSVTAPSLLFCEAAQNSADPGPCNQSGTLRDLAPRECHHRGPANLSACCRPKVLLEVLHAISEKAADQRPHRQERATGRHILTPVLSSIAESIHNAKFMESSVAPTEVALAASLRPDRATSNTSLAI